LEIGNYNKAFGQPHPKKVKKLTVTYRVNGQEQTKVFAENKPITFK